MADGADKKGSEKEEKKGSSFSTKVSVFTGLLTAVLFLPTTMVFIVCMIPTFVAAIVDNNQQKTAWLTVGAMNVAGFIPVWLSLIDSGHTIAAAFQIIMNPSSLLIAYAGAAVGWAIYNHVTPLIASVIQGKNERRLQEIDRRQKALVKKWGDGVVAK